MAGRRSQLEEHGSGYAAAEGPVYDQAPGPFRDAWGVEPVDMGVGGSIPFISGFAARFPDATIIVTASRTRHATLTAPN